MANIQRPKSIFWIALAVIIVGMILLRVPPVDGFWTLTAAPILLVLGYIVLAPLGLLPRKEPSGSFYSDLPHSGRIKHLHYGAAGVFIVSFIIYTITLWPGPGWWDSSDYALCCHILGIPGPPGSFLLELIGRIVVALIPIFKPPIIINLLMALFSALAAAVVYYITVRIVSGFNYERSSSNTSSILAGITAGLTLAFMHSIWCKATFANAYALSLLTGCILIYLVILWWEKADVSGGGNYLLLAALVLGLDLSVHRSNLFLAPFFIVLILIRRPKAFLDWRLWLGAVFIFIVGISMQFGLMLRAQLNPQINFGDPSSLSALWDYINLKQFNISIFGLDLFTRKGPFWSYQVKEMYLRYIGWNFIGLGGDGVKMGLSGMYGIPLLFGIGGMIIHFIRRFRQGLMFFIAFLFASLGVIFYLNVPAGFFREMDRHFVVSFMIIAVWSGIAVYATLYYLPKLLSKTPSFSKIIFTVMAMLILIILPFNMLYANFSNNNMSNDYTAYAFGNNILRSCEPDAILITAGDSDTFTPWYSRIVEGVRPDVTVLNIHLLNTTWYLKSTMTYYPDFPWSLTADSLDELRPIMWDSSAVEIVTDDNSYPPFEFMPQPSFREYLINADQVLINILKTNMWKRPIYFSLAFGENLPLGLKQYCRLDGLVRRLCPDSISREDISRLEDNVWNYDYCGYGDYDFLDLTGFRMGQNYFACFAGLVEYYKSIDDNAKLNELKKLFLQHWPGEQRADMLFQTGGNEGDSN